MRRRAVRRNSQRGTGVVAQYRRARLGRIGRRHRGVVGGFRRNSQIDGCCRGLSARIGDGVGEGIRPGKARRWGVRVRAVRSDRDGAVRGIGVPGHGQTGTDVGGQDGGAAERSVGRRETGVIHCRGRDGKGHRRRGRLARRVGARVGKRVRSAVSSGWRVRVRAVRVDGERSVSGVRVPGHRQS